MLVCGRDPFRYAGGLESFVRAHALVARELGLHPHLFGLGDRAEVCEMPEGTLHSVRNPARRVRVRSFAASLYAPWLGRAVVRFLADRRGPHVIHAFGGWGDVGRGACAALARRGVETALVTTAWSTMAHESRAKLESEVITGSRRLLYEHRAEAAWATHISRRFEHRAYIASRAVIVNYESVRRLLEEAYGPDLRIRRTTYAAPTAFEPEPAAGPEPAELARLGEPDAPLIVTVSRHDGRKGLDVFIRALATLRDAGIPFRACLVGPGPLLAGHRALVADLGLADRVALPGTVLEVTPYLRAADVFVLPSIEEGSGSLSVLEALQTGVAIVSSDVDGMAEDLTDGEDAVLVPPGDTAALADALTGLLADPARRERLARAGRALYERRFSPAAAAADLGAVYAEVGLPVRRIASATRATSSSDTDGPEGR